MVTSFTGNHFLGERSDFLHIVQILKPLTLDEKPFGSVNMAKGKNGGEIRSQDEIKKGRCQIDHSAVGPRAYQIYQNHRAPIGPMGCDETRHILVNHVTQAQ